MPRLPKSIESNQVKTAFINCNYKNCNENPKIFLHQNVAFVTNYEPINLTQKPGLVTCHQYMSGMCCVGSIYGIWFYDRDECARLGQLMNRCSSIFVVC